MEASILIINKIDIQQNRRTLANEFRRPNLLLNEAKRLQTVHEKNIAELEARMKEFDSLSIEIKSLGFRERVLNFRLSRLAFYH